MVSMPNRYSPNKMVALEDLERTARLLAGLVWQIEDGLDFIRQACHCETRRRGKVIALPLLRVEAILQPYCHLRTSVQKIPKTKCSNRITCITPVM
jgi:hypothetical protein